MRARGILALSIVAAVVAVAIGGLAGCSKKLRPIQNLPPDTYVFVQGAVDTVNHRVHMYWYGTDPDGRVVGYAYRWVYPLPASQSVKWDTILCDTVLHCTDSMFTVVTGGVGDTVVVMPRFEIYAIDNQGASDPTPAVETFSLRNVAPVVQFTNPLGSRDTTYASATVNWDVVDRDGGGPGLHYRVWLDGNEAVYDSTDALTFTVPSARFLQDGEYRSGPRTLYVQAVDDGGFRGAPASMTWYVRAPAAVLENHQGRLLVVDEAPLSDPSKALYDAFYKSVADLLPNGNRDYDVLRLYANPNTFRSGRDLAQTFRQFRAVMWYRGGVASVSPVLKAFQDSIGAFLDTGGKLYLDGLYLIEGLHTPGSFREDFVTRHLGSTRLIYCWAPIGGGATDSTAGWSSRAGSAFRSSRYGESIVPPGETFRPGGGPGRLADSTGAIRGFAVTDTNNVAIWAMDGQLVPVNTGFEVPIGVTVPQGANGRIILLTIPVRFAPPLLNGVPVAKNLLQRMLHDFGIGIPDVP
jgi:hypothetical protein